MDWDDFRIPLAIARHGSLNAAARALGITQPTVSRRLDRLERRIGVKLFERASSGLSPTPLCATLIDQLGQMEEGAQAIERRIAARDTGLQGKITVTSLAWFGDDVLAPLLARFATRHRLVTIDLINDPRRFNLSRGEADVALRLGTFDQQDLVERKVPDVSLRPLRVAGLSQPIWTAGLRKGLRRPYRSRSGRLADPGGALRMAEGGRAACARGAHDQWHAVAHGDCGGRRGDGRAAARAGRQTRQPARPDPN